MNMASRSSGFRIILRPRLPTLSGSDILAAFVPGYGGGSATVSHRLPYRGQGPLTHYASILRITMSSESSGFRCAWHSIRVSSPSLFEGDQYHSHRLHERLTYNNLRYTHGICRFRCDYLSLLALSGVGTTPPDI
jgi:hypothetical protein